MVLRNLFSKHPLFQSLPKEYNLFLEKCAHTSHYPADGYLFHEGAEANRFFFIVQGKVALEIHVPGHPMVSFETIPRGHVVGWSWSQPPHSWVFDGRAVREVEAVVFDGARVREKMEQDHEFGFLMFRYFAGIMNKRIVSSRMQLMDIYDAKKGNEYL
ncbi:MAG: cyclic nucleotide-binding domain-containing protein [Leptospirales bacterium]